MKCANCGFEIPNGKLYCPECGTEVRLVPDFLTVSMERQQLLREQAMLDQQNGRREEAARHGSHMRPATAFLYAILTVVIAAGLSFLMIFYIYQHALGNFGFLASRAERAYTGKNYPVALTYCDRALNLKPGSVDCGILKSKILMKMQNIQGAEAVLRDVYAHAPDSEEACRELILLLLSESDLEGVSEIVGKCPFPSITDAYGGYLTKAPVLSLVNGGIYPYGTELSMDSTCGRIYYTTDGTDPGPDDILYMKPIVLPPGVNRIHAVCINDFGMKSDVVKMICTIE